MTCEHVFVHHNQMKFCRHCGLSKSFIKLDKYSPHASPLGRHYDRFHRFQTKIDRLLGIGSYPPADDPVWDILRQGKMESPTDVRNVLRHSKLFNKHYDCVRRFTDVFTTFTTSIDVLKTKESLEHKFKLIKSLWGIREGFFSYDWLLRKFLEEMKSPLVQYLKKPTNRRRERKYTKMMDFIRHDNVNKTYCQSLIEARSQSV